MEEKDEKELLQEIEEYNKKIEENPNNATYYKNRGNTYFDLKKFEEAIKDYDKAIELDSNNATYYKNRGFTYSRLKNFEEAIKDYDKAIKLDSNNATYYNNRGNTYFGLKKFENSFKDYNKAIELNANNDIYYYNRGLTYAKLKKFDRVVEDYNIAMKLNPKENIYKKLIALKNNIERNKKSAKSNNNILDTEFKDIISEQSNKTNNIIENVNNYEDNDENIMYNDAVNKHLNAKTDEEFDVAAKKFESFIAQYKGIKNKNPKLFEEAELYLIASKERVRRLKGYLTFADILGWKGIWQKQNTSNGKIDNIKKLLSIKNELERKSDKKEEPYEIKLISDTFVIYTRNAGLSEKLSKQLIELCLEKELLIRGAISYGELYNEDMVYIGQAVDEAASWYEKGEEIGIFYTSSARLQIKEENKKFDLLDEEVYVKSGKLKTLFINWYNKDNQKNFYKIMKKEIIHPEYSLKYFNTEKRLEKVLNPNNDKKSEE